MCRNKYKVPRRFYLFYSIDRFQFSRTINFVGLRRELSAWPLVHFQPIVDIFATTDRSKSADGEVPVTARALIEGTLGFGLASGDTIEKGNRGQKLIYRELVDGCQSYMRNLYVYIYIYIHTYHIYRFFFFLYFCFHEKLGARYWVFESRVRQKDVFYSLKPRRQRKSVNTYLSVTFIYIYVYTRTCASWGIIVLGMTVFYCDHPSTLDRSDINTSF